MAFHYLEHGISNMTNYWVNTKVSLILYKNKLKKKKKSQMDLQYLFLCEVLEQACNQGNIVQKAKLYLRCSLLIETGIHTMMPFNKYMDLTWSYIYMCS